MKIKIAYNVYEIPISMIQQEASPAPDKQFVADIKERGVLQPVELTKGLGGKFKIIWGRRRIFGAELAGKTTVPAIIKDNVEDIDVLTLIENHQRTQNIGVELKAVRALIRKGNDLKEIAAMLHLNISKLKKIYRLDNLSDRWLGLVCGGHVTEAKALQVSRLPKEKQDFILSEHSHQVAPKQIQSYIREASLEAAQTLFSGVEELPKYSSAQMKLDELVNMILVTGKVEITVLSAIETLRNFVNAEMGSKGKMSEGVLSNGNAEDDAAKGMRDQGAGADIRLHRGIEVRAAA